MASFLTTRGTTSEIERIINTAQNRLVLISPYIKVPDSLLQNLQAADQRGVRTEIVYGKKRQLDAGVERQLGKLKHMELLFLENLHAKCYFNEQWMVVTSLNLYDFSEQNNREMGVLITKHDDLPLFEEARREADLIIGLASGTTGAAPRRSPVRTQPGQQQKTTEKKPKSILAKLGSEIVSGMIGSDRGYCIGCKTRIDLDTDKPSCLKCYWPLRRNKRKAKYCHECGREFKTTLNTPRCLSCYEKSQAI